jgi:hypothetical protein
MLTRKLRDIFARRRHPRHPARRVVPRAEPGEAPSRGLGVHHHGRLARRPPEPSAASPTGSTSSTSTCCRDRRRARQGRRPRPPGRLDLRLLRLRQVELRQAPRPRARRHRAARRPFARRGPGSKRDTSPRAPAELRDAWDRSAPPRSTPWPWSSTSAAVARDNEHVHAAVVRQVQARLGYCSTEPIGRRLRARLERDGEWTPLREVAQRQPSASPGPRSRTWRSPRRTSRW